MLSLCLLVALFSGPAGDFDVLLMKSTFKIVGAVDTAGHGYGGVGFLAGVPHRLKGGSSRWVMVTAAHVLDTMKLGWMQIHLRQSRADGSYGRIVREIRIRDGDLPRYVRHPDSTVDAAAMYVELPAGIDVLSVPLAAFADDGAFERLGVHPGDELYSLGFPFGTEGSPAGFPILRGGRIASYPLTPTATVRQFFLSTEVFPGNSGGPVYLVTPPSDTGSSAAGYVVGLVSERKVYAGDDRSRESLALAVVVPARFILETINRLPKD